MRLKGRRKKAKFKPKTGPQRGSKTGPQIGSKTGQF